LTNGERDWIVTHMASCAYGQSEIAWMIRHGVIDFVEGTEYPEEDDSEDVVVHEAREQRRSVSKRPDPKRPNHFLWFLIAVAVVFMFVFAGYSLLIPPRHSQQQTI